ncbi:MAG: ABC transporter permease [Eubacterium sp.]|nr:ABC transporter permease [Eubacterium sp.]
MKQFKDIFTFEMGGHLRNKAFIGVTIILVVLIAGWMFFPRITEAFSGGDDKGGEQVKTKVALFVEGDVDAELAKMAFAAEPVFETNEIVLESDLAQLREKVLSGEYTDGFGIHDLQTYTYYVKTLNVYSNMQPSSDDAMKRLNYYTKLKQTGMSEDQIEATGKVQITGTAEVLGNDQAQNYFYTYIMIFALYMIILLYGQMVATNVASEKSSRAMEVLITSAKPTALMFGKILASCVAGFMQLVLIFGTALLTYNLNSSYWEDNGIVTSLFNIPAEMFLYMLLFFLLGFLLYAMMYGAIGSMATKVEDINTLQTPITFLFIIAFMVVVYGMNQDVNNPVMVVASYVPFTSPMAMFTRVAMGAIPVYEIAISVVILILSTIGIGVLAARIYRAGVLHYGKAPKFTEILAKAKRS